MELQQIFGKRLEQLLLEKGISQGEFAEAVGCSRRRKRKYGNDERVLLAYCF